MHLRFKHHRASAIAFNLLALCVVMWASALAEARGPLPPELQPLELNVTNDFNYRWGEPVIAINPKNPNNIIYHVNQSEYTYKCQKEKIPACATMKVQDMRTDSDQIDLPNGQITSPSWANNQVYVSFNRGRTWKHVEINREVVGSPLLSKAFGSDPVVRATQDGTFWIIWEPAHIGHMPITAPGNYGCPVVSKSTDGGLTWSKAACAGTPVDHEWLEIDDSTGTIYEASSGALGPMGDGNPDSPTGTFADRWLVTSKDGVHWSKPQQMGGSDRTAHYMAGGLWMVAANGVLATAYTSTTAPACRFFVGSDGPCVVFQTTTDGGVTWKRHRVPTSSDVSTDMFSAFVPVTGNKQKPGHYAVAVMDSKASKYLVYRTADSGATWSAPTEVTDDATKPHFKASMSSSPTGVVGMMWRATQAGGGYNIWAAVSGDEGATFSEPLQVSRGTSPPNEPSVMGNFTDDLSDITLDDKEAFIGWGDWRPGDRQGFISIVKLEAFRHK